MNASFKTVNLRKIRKFALSVAIPLLVGLFAFLLTNQNQNVYEQIQKPFLAPPSWLFGVVWPILYILMGISTYLVNTTDADMQKVFSANIVYWFSLVLNFFWSIIFFNERAFAVAFVWIVILLITIIWTAVKFYNINKTAGYLMLPYIAWVCFAAYLSLSIWLLNR